MDQLRAAETWVAERCPEMPALWRGERYRHDRIRVAYLSADYHSHATAYLAAGLFEAHDRVALRDDGDLVRSRRFERDARTPEARIRPLHRRARQERRRHGDAAQGDGDRHRCRPQRLHPGRAARDPRVPASARAGELSRPSRHDGRALYRLPDRRPPDRPAKDTSATTARRSSAFPTRTRPTTASAASPSARRRARTRGFPIPASCSARSTAASRSRRSCSTSGCACSNPSKEACSGCSTTIPQPCATSSAKPRRAACRRNVSSLRRDGRSTSTWRATVWPTSSSTRSRATPTPQRAMRCGRGFRCSPAPATRSRAASPRACSSRLELPELITDSLSSYEAMAMKLALDPMELAQLKAKLAAQRNTAPLFDTERFARDLESAVRDDVGALAARDAGRELLGRGGAAMTAADLSEAWRLHRAGEHEKAARLYLDVLRDDPTNYEALYRLAFLCGQLGRWEDAQSLMGHAIALNHHVSRALCFSEEARCRSSIVTTRPSPVRPRARADPRIAEVAPQLRGIPLPPAPLRGGGRRVWSPAGYRGRLSVRAREPSILPTAMLRLAHAGKRDGRRSWPDMRAGRRVIAPFDAKALFLSAEDELACARAWAANQHPGATAPSPQRSTAAPLTAARRLHLGRFPRRPIGDA